VLDGSALRKLQKPRCSGLPVTDGSLVVTRIAKAFGRTSPAELTEPYRSPLGKLGDMMGRPALTHVS
jgi:hypothetical protein